MPQFGPRRTGDADPLRHSISAAAGMSLHPSDDAQALTCIRGSKRFGDESLGVHQTCLPAKLVQPLAKDRQLFLDSVE